MRCPARTVGSRLFGLLLLAFPHCGWADTFTVNSVVDAVDANPGNGVCEATPGMGDCSLRAAIIETNALEGMHQIEVPAGIHLLTLLGEDDDSQVGDLDVIGSELTIAGAGRDDTIVDGGGIDRVLSVNVSDVTVRDLTIRNGAATAASVLGGAISLVGGPQPNNLLLQRVHLTNNSANAGGAVFAASNGVIVIEDSLFSENTTVPLGVTNQNGPALYCLGCSVDVYRSTFTANHVGGKAITVETDAVLRVLNSTISGNDEGGIRTQNADAWIRSSTLADNGAQNLSHFSFDDTKFLQIGNSVLQHADNDNCQSGDLPVSLGYNVTSDTSCGFAMTGDVQNTDAMLGPLQDNGGPTETHLPGAGSALIDAIPAPDCTGLEGAALTVDQRGFTRPVGGGCDIGAVEVVIELLFADGFE